MEETSMAGTAVLSQHGHQHPGQVVRMGGAQPLPTFNFIGSHRLLDRLPNRREFLFDLTEVLVKAGFGGDFTVVVRTPVKGTSHTKGLTIKSPHKDGVLIHAHYGSNDSNIEILLVCPAFQRDPHKFSSFLKEAAVALTTEDEDAVRVRLRSYQAASNNDNRFNNFVHRLTKMLPAPTQEARQAAPLPAPSTPPPAPAAEVAPPSAMAMALTEAAVARRVPLYKDDDMLILFLGEVAPLRDGRGFVARNKCLDLLVEHGLSETKNGSGSVLKGLLNRGVFTTAATSSDRLAISALWLDRLGLSTPASQTTQVQVPAPAAASLNLGNLVALQKRGEEIRGLRARQKGLDARVGTAQTTVDEQRARLRTAEAELAKLEQERTFVETSLADPEVAQVESVLEGFRKLLGTV